MSIGISLMLIVNLTIIAVLAWLFWKVLTIPRHDTIGKGDRWRTRIGLVLAMAGNAVGLGNFLRFPVEAIKNGGGAFIIPYLVCFLLMGIPLMLVEWASGRYAGKKGIHDTPGILQSLSSNPFWKYVGALGLFTNIIVASYYVYVESWALSYVIYSFMGTFKGLSQAEVSVYFDQHTGIPNSLTIGTWIFCILINLYFISRGVGNGIEKVARVGMPLLLLFGIILALQSLSIQAGHQGAVTNGFDGLKFLWNPDFSSIWSPKVWLAAAGQVFFTLSVGVGAIQCYASYVSENEDIVLNALSSGWMNEFVEVVIGAAIVIPISIGYLGLENVLQIVNGSGSGFSLGFRTLPYLFQQWGTLMSITASLLWFGILFFAGITSSLAMGLPFISLMKDSFKWSSAKTTVAFGLTVFILGFLPVFYFNEGGMNEYDYWAGSVSLVIFACAEIILFGWFFGINKGWKEINEGADLKLPIIFKYVIQYITPIFLITILLGNASEWFNTLTNPNTTVIQWVARGIMLCVLIGIMVLLKIAENRKSVKP